MTTTANYIIKAVVGGETYVFQYEDAMDAWEAMEQFWHDDYPEVLADKKGSEVFPISVYAMDDGKALCEYPFMFNAAVFHAFYDHGHKADGIYTLDEFAKDISLTDNVNDNDNHVELKKNAAIEREQSQTSLNSAESEQGRRKSGNDVTSFFFYMWNRWDKAECRRVFAGDDYNHFWDKWCHACKRMNGASGAAEVFYAELSNGNRTKLVRRACECYDGQSER